MQTKNFQITKSGHNIKCKMYYGDKSNIQNVIIYVHGFAGHKDNNAAQKLAEKMISKKKTTALVIFDLPGHGEDVKKRISLEDCNTYLEFVISHVKEEYGEARIYASGTSFGCYLILKYIQEHDNPFAKIALRSPAVNMYELMITKVLEEDDYVKLDKGKDVLRGFDRKVGVDKKFIESLKENDLFKYDYMDFADDILLIHGEKDEIVPVNRVVEFSEKNVIELIVEEGADHRFRNPLAMGNVIKNIMNWFDL